MPRAGVHAHRDARILELALREAGIHPPRDLAARLRTRHRALDSLVQDSDASLHFMRGPEEEDAPEAVAKALGFARDRAWHAVEELAAWRRGPEDASGGAALESLADVCHVVRDSFSTGHAVRWPAPGGAWVVGLRAWERDRRAGMAFGLVHALRHDLRFEFPLRGQASEVPASDAAVLALTRLLARASLLEGAERGAYFEEGWALLVARHFLPPGAPEPLAAP
jgi:hypothetical protein